MRGQHRLSLLPHGRPADDMDVFGTHDATPNIEGQGRMGAG